MTDDENLTAIATRGYMDAIGLLSKIASLVDVDGVITANDLLDGVRAVVAERNRLRAELEEERHQVAVEAGEADRIEDALTQEINRLRHELNQLQQQGRPQ